VLCQGAAIRFALTRLFDWVNTPPGAMVTRKDRCNMFAACAPPDRKDGQRLWNLSPQPPRPRPPIPTARRTWVEIWTDGGCKPNPGRGGWAAILRCRGVSASSRAEAVATNNRMELTAAAAALESLKRPCRVILHTDSELPAQRHHPLAHRLGPPQLAQCRRRPGGQHGFVAPRPRRREDPQDRVRWVRGHRHRHHEQPRRRAGDRRPRRVDPGNMASGGITVP